MKEELTNAELQEFQIYEFFKIITWIILNLISQEDKHCPVTKTSW